MSIGIALFVLIIIVGLIIGLRLSSTSLQRRAVAVSFVLMALVAAAFWAVAMGASQVWTAPFFAIACIVVPVAAYSAIMKASKSSRPEPKRREDSRPRQAKTGSALEAAVMPVAPNHPVNEFRDLHSGPETTDGEEQRDEIAGAAEPAAAPVAEDAEAVSAESAGAAEESGTAPKADEPQERAEAFIDEYLIEQNEGEDGMFEPEMAPSLQPRTEAPHTTSTMMMTVPFPEGDEQYLVVSDTTSVPNPILAYKRTTSSHLVPLGASRRGIHAKPSAEAEEASVQDRRSAASGGGAGGAGRARPRRAPRQRGLRRHLPRGPQGRRRPRGPAAGTRFHAATGKPLQAGVPPRGQARSRGIGPGCPHVRPGSPDRGALCRRAPPCCRSCRRAPP